MAVCKRVRDSWCQVIFKMDYLRRKVASERTPRPFLNSVFTWHSRLLHPADGQSVHSTSAQRFCAETV